MLLKNENTRSFSLLVKQLFTQMQTIHENYAKLEQSIQNDKVPVTILLQNSCFTLQKTTIDLLSILDEIAEIMNCVKKEFSEIAAQLLMGKDCIIHHNGNYYVFHPGDLLYLDPDLFIKQRSIFIMTRTQIINDCSIVSGYLEFFTRYIEPYQLAQKCNPQFWQSLRNKVTSIIELVDLITQIFDTTMPLSERTQHFEELLNYDKIN